MRDAMGETAIRHGVAMTTNTLRRRWFWILGVLGAVALSSASVFALAGGTTAASPSGDMAALAPPGIVAETDIPAGVVPLYHGAVENSTVFAATPCYCGCMEMLGHRHLLDCFERPDGSGWESHALGCGVCLGEADQVLDLVAGGVEPDAIVAAVVAEWSDPYLSEE